MAGAGFIPGSRCPAMLLGGLLFLLAPSPGSAVPVPGLPPLRAFLEDVDVGTGGLAFEPMEGRWERVEIREVDAVAEPGGLLAAWSWWFREDGWRGRAEERAEEWLGLGELDLGPRRMRATKDLGSRLRLTTFTGYQSSSQRMLRAEYDLAPGLVVRSEARERGESRLVIDREQRFR